MVELDVSNSARKEKMIDNNLKENMPVGLRKCVELLEELCEYNQETIYEALNVGIQNQNADRLISAIRRIAADIEQEVEENRKEWLCDVRMEQMKNGN